MCIEIVYIYVYNFFKNFSVPFFLSFSADFMEFYLTLTSFSYKIKYAIFLLKGMIYHVYCKLFTLT